MHPKSSLDDTQRRPVCPHLSSTQVPNMHPSIHLNMTCYAALVMCKPFPPLRLNSDEQRLSRSTAAITENLLSCFFFLFHPSGRIICSLGKKQENEYISQIQLAATCYSLQPRHAFPLPKLMNVENRFVHRGVLHQQVPGQEDVRTYTGLAQTWRRPFQKRPKNEIVQGNKKKA